MPGTRAGGGRRFFSGLGVAVSAPAYGLCTDTGITICYTMDRARVEEWMADPTHRSYIVAPGTMAHKLAREESGACAMHHKRGSDCLCGWSGR